MAIRMSPPIGRILLVKPSALGDVCRSMPILASLRNAHPGARIDWLVQEDFADVVRGHPALHAAITFPRRAWRRWWHPGVIAEVLAFARALGRARYDLVLDLQGLFRSGFFMWSTGARRRVGWLHAREGAWLAANERYPVRGGSDATERMLALLEDAGVAPVRDARIHLPPGSADAWRNTRGDLGVDGRFIMLAPTSRWTAKRWPAQRWRELAADLVQQGHRVVMVGEPSERAQVQAAMPPCGVVNLCGRLPLAQWLAAIADADAVVANDSAAIHAAAGLGRPLVGIYGATDPRQVGPYQRGDCVVSAEGEPPSDPHAYRHDAMAARMASIGVDRVRSLLQRELSRGPRW